MNIHMNRPTGSEAVGEIDVDKMKRYVAYCKTCVVPFASLFPSVVFSLRSDTFTLII